MLVVVGRKKVLAIVTECTLTSRFISMSPRFRHKADMKHRVPIFSTALVSVLLPLAVQAMPPAQDWTIGPWARGKNYSIGMPDHPDSTRDGAPTFRFPVAGSGEIDAMTTEVGPLAGAKAIRMRYRIDAAKGTRFMPSEFPDRPALISFYFQRKGDNWTAKGRYASYRWYVPADKLMEIEPGTHTVIVRLDERWTNVWGKPNTEKREEYLAALNNTARIGIAFGSSGGRSHGVYATGPARFTLLDFEVVE